MRKSIIVILLFAFVIIGQLTSCNKTSDESSCDPATSFSNTVKPILDKSCNTVSCHDDLVITALNKFQTVHDGAQQIKISIQSGRMPKGGTLSSTDKNAIFCWIDNGAKNN